MVHKNHPAIFSWSMGNEVQCKGPNHAAMANWIRYYDPTRLVQYESAGPEAIISDLRGNMYAQPDHIINMLADARDTRPIVLVEYLYQIRNAGGGMSWFAELLERFERFQGGFVWDWQDKCLLATDRKGKPFCGYGGDFAEDLVERTVPKHMTCNGVVLPDLTPKPVVYEIKNVQSPIQIVAVHAEARQVQAEEPPSGRRHGRLRAVLPTAGERSGHPRRQAADAGRQTHDRRRVRSGPEDVAA